MKSLAIIILLFVSFTVSAGQKPDLTPAQDAWMQCVMASVFLTAKVYSNQNNILSPAQFKQMANKYANEECGPQPDPGTNM